MEIDTRKLQLALLETMKGFHKACIENNITYYMVGGTFLGAIRHNGFIPWDDDMDIGLPRADYERLCRIAGEILPPNLALRFYKTTENSPFHFVKLVNTNTTLVEKNYKNYVEGIYIDVFPLDGIERFDIFAKTRAKTIRFLHALIMNHYYTGGSKPGLKNLFMKMAKKMNMKPIHYLMDQLMKKDKNPAPNYYCNFLGAYKDREVIEREVFGKPVLYRFEDTDLFGPEIADAFLTKIYGDYMTLPPKEKRVNRHDYYYVNLDLPFSVYSEELTKSM